MSAGTSSVLPNNTYANPIQELWTPAGGGGGGGGAGVTQIVAGTNVTISPGSGEGVVTINATGGGGSPGVTSIVAGTGITASAPTGDVTLVNTGVTSLVAGTNVVLSGATGAVTVSVPTSTPSSFVYFGELLPTNAPCLASCYTRIGQMVTVSGRINLTGASGDTDFSLPAGVISQLPPYKTGGESGFTYDNVFLVTGGIRSDGFVALNAVATAPTGLLASLVLRIKWSGAGATNFVWFTLTYPTNA
jgi:hypothetical protein